MAQLIPKLSDCLDWWPIGASVQRQMMRIVLVWFS